MGFVQLVINIYPFSNSKCGGEIFNVMEYFEKIIEEDGKIKFKCMYCGQDSNLTRPCRMKTHFVQSYSKERVEPCSKLNTIFLDISHVVKAIKAEIEMRIDRPGIDVMLLDQVRPIANQAILAFIVTSEGKGYNIMFT